jgi:transposase
MRTPTPIPERARAVLLPLLKKAKGKRQYQRVLCIWLRAEMNMPPTKIAMALGWSLGYVRQVQARYLKEGERALNVEERGGRYRENLSISEESALLAPFFAKAEKGELLLVTEIKRAYEARLGHKVPKSTVYRVLDRHGWRKIAPRPHHPKSDPAAQEAFKKTSRQS